MPIVVPHTAAGIALLTVLSPGGFIGDTAGKIGIEFVDAMPGIIAAMLFLAAPFTVNAARSAFESINPRLENVSRSLGATAGQTFFRISLPLAIGQIVSGAIMCWARAVSEFGAVLVIAYYPRVGPVLMYDRFTSYGLTRARPVAVVLVLISWRYSLLCASALATATAETPQASTDEPWSQTSRAAFLLNRPGVRGMTHARNFSPHVREPLP